MSKKTRVRLAVLSALAALAALMAGGTAAQADPMKYLIVDVTPSTATAMVQETFTVDVTNAPSNNTELGAVEITSPFDITGVVSVAGTFASNETPLTKSWTLTWDGTSKKFQLTANTQMDRLSPGEFVSVEVDATPPYPYDNSTPYNWKAVGRQANTFNDGVDGNIVFQDLSQGSYTTTVTGTAVDCSEGPCKGSQTASQTAVTVSADCLSGMLVVDTTLNVDPNQIGAAAFFSYFSGDCEGEIATVAFSFAKSLVGSPGGLEFAADYGSKDINALYGYPSYVNGTTFPSCNANKGVVVNCVDSLKGGSTSVDATIKMVLTDPLSYGRK